MRNVTDQWTPSFRVLYPIRCVTYGCGVIGTLVLYGLFQERIMAFPYDGEYFAGSTLLVLYNRIFGIPFALLMLRATSEDLACTAPLWKYVVISVSAVAASIFQYEALKYISFTVQMLGKSCRMVPVMFWGVVISGKQYVMIDWFTSIVVSMSVAEFLLTGPIKATGSEYTSLYGLVMLLAFVALDSFTATFQEKLFRDHLTSKYNQMLYINLVSAVITLVSLLMSGFTSESVSFCARHPDIIADASLLSLVAVLAQWFIYSQVQEYGALVFSATMNVRQIISVVTSYVAYGHPISGLQALGLVAFCSAITLRSIVGLSKEARETAPLLEGGVPELPDRRAKVTSFFRKQRGGCCVPWGLAWKV